VWWKRIVYFATLGLTFALLLLPLLSDTESQACTSPFCWLSPAIGALDLVLPKFTSGWTNWYVTNPGIFILLAGLVAFGLLKGSGLEQKIQDAMRSAWYAIDGARPTSVGNAPVARTASRLDAMVLHLRTNRFYQATLRLLTWRVLPTGFLVALAWVVVGLGGAGISAMRVSSGNLCEKTQIEATVVGEVPRAFVLDPTSICAPTGLALQAGATYRVDLVVQKPLKDATAAADLRGVRPTEVSWIMRASSLLKREFTQPWFAPMARIGERGTDVYALKPDPSVPFKWPLDELSTKLVARSSGELFLYVNDAVGPPGWTRFFYDNNGGTLQVVVSRIRPESMTPAPAMAETTPEGPATVKR